jgi:hypothetical protein
VGDFTGSRTKLDRAQQQLYALNHACIGYAERKPYRLDPNFQMRPGEEVGDYRFTVRDLRQPSPTIATHVGEIVHNYRSALDLLAYSCARRPWRKTQFPIFGRRADWDEKAEPMIRTVPERYVTVIEEAQPYRNRDTGRDPRNHVLSVLTLLSNRDKHRSLHTAVANMQGAAPGFEGTGSFGTLRGVQVHLGPLEEGIDLVTFVFEPDGGEPEIELYGDFALDVTFSDSSAAARVIDGQSVVHVLSEIGRYVEKVYARFDMA